MRQALERGAAKVYAAARKSKQWDAPRVQPLSLDLKPEDVDMLINNHLRTGGRPSPDFESNFFGTLRVVNAFTPVLAAND